MNIWDKLSTVVSLMVDIVQDGECPLWVAGLCIGFINGAKTWSDSIKAANDEAARLEVFERYLKARTE